MLTKQLFTRLIPAAVTMLASVSLAQNLPEPPTTSAGEMPALLQKMQGGGYVLFFRHLDTRQDQEDKQPVNLNSCEGQRNLSEEGKARGRNIGQALKKARVPIGDVISSPFCRTIESAHLIAGRAQTDADLFFAIALTDAGKKQKGVALRKLLAQIPPKGKNNIVISHTANLQEAVGLWPKPEGVAYLMRPDGKGNIEGIARIPPESWSSAKP